MSRRPSSKPVSVVLAALLGALFLLPVARAGLSPSHAIPLAAPHDITLDGSMDEPEWVLLGTSAGGPAPSTGFGTGHEVNALYAYNDNSYLYLGVAGNVQTGHRILVFIDALTEGYTTANFGRASAPPGLAAFNPATTFDAAFSPDYALVIGANAAHDNYTWDLYTLSNSGGPNVYLGDNTAPHVHADPLNASLTHGFETRLTFNSPGAGVDLRINQNFVKFFALYISEAGGINNQFITPANPGEMAYGAGPINFVSAAPNNVDYQMRGGTGSASGMVISEFQARGVNGANDEFIELYNSTTAPISIGGWRLNLSSSAGITTTFATVTSATTLNPGCHYLLTNANPSGGPYSGIVPGNQTYTSGVAGLPDNGGLALAIPAK